MDKAIEQGDVQAVLEALDKSPLLLDAFEVGEERVTPLIWAAAQGQTAVVRALLERGANVDLQDQDGRTALMRAAAKDHKDVVRVLLDRGASANLQDQDGRTALMEVAAQGHEDVVSILVRHGAEVDIQARHGRTALMEAVARVAQDEKADVLILLMRGAQVDLQDQHGWTALMEAAADGQTAVVRLLVAHGATLDVQDQHGRTALMKAAAQGQKDIVSILLESGAIADLRDKHGKTALTRATEQSHLEIVELLRGRGAGANLPDEEARSASAHAVVARAKPPDSDLVDLTSDEDRDTTPRPKDSARILEREDPLVHASSHETTNKPALPLAGASSKATADEPSATSSSAASHSAKSPSDSSKTRGGEDSIHRLKFLKLKARPREGLALDLLRAADAARHRKFLIEQLRMSTARTLARAETVDASAFSDEDLVVVALAAKEAGCAMKTLKVRNADLSEIGLRNIAKALRLAKIKSLDLSGCTFDANDLQWISAAITLQQTELLDLTLAGIEFSAQSAHAFFRALTGSRLKTLDLSNCKIDPADAEDDADKGDSVSMRDVHSSLLQAAEKSPRLVEIAGLETLKGLDSGQIEDIRNALKARASNKREGPTSDALDGNAADAKRPRQEASVHLYREITQEMLVDRGDRVKKLVQDMRNYAYECEEKPLAKVEPFELKTSSPIIGVFNAKGGVGKTNNVMCTAAALAAKGKRVLMVDMDVKCDLTSFLQVNVARHDDENEDMPSLFGDATDAASVPFSQAEEEYTNNLLFTVAVPDDDFDAEELIRLGKTSTLPGVKDVYELLNPAMSGDARGLKPPKALMPVIAPGQKAEDASRLFYLAGSPNLAEFESNFSVGLPENILCAHSGAFRKLLRETIHVHELDYVLVDFGTYESTMNQVFLLSCDYLLPPVFADAFSLCSMRIFLQHTVPKLEKMRDKLCEYRNAMVQDKVRGFLLDHELPRILPFVVTNFEFTLKSEWPFLEAKNLDGKFVSAMRQLIKDDALIKDSKTHFIADPEDMVSALCVNLGQLQQLSHRFGIPAFLLDREVLKHIAKTSPRLLPEGSLNTLINAWSHASLSYSRLASYIVKVTGPAKSSA